MMGQLQMHADKNKIGEATARALKRCTVKETGRQRVREEGTTLKHQCGQHKGRQLLLNARSLRKNGRNNHQCVQWLTHERRNLSTPSESSKSTRGWRLCRFEHLIGHPSTFTIRALDSTDPISVTCSDRISIY